MLPHPNAWSKQTHVKGRGREVKLINPQILAWIPVHQQSYCSSSLTDKHHSVSLMGTNSTPTISPWEWSLSPASGSQHDPIWIHPGRSNPTQVWMLGEMSHSNDTLVRGHAQHLPPTHECKQNSKPAQDSCWFSSHSQKPATVPLFTTEFPQLMLPWCTHIAFAAGRLKAPWAGSISHSLYKKSPNWQSPENWSQQLLPCSGQVRFPC